jgi:hypothetical protein
MGSLALDQLIVERAEVVRRNLTQILCTPRTHAPVTASAITTPWYCFTKRNWTSWSIKDVADYDVDAVACVVSHGDP